MKNVLGFLTVVLFCTSAWAVPYGDLVLHLQGGVGIVEEGGKVVAWQDQSGEEHNALNLKQSSVMSADELPVLESNALNGNPMVRFDGVDDGLAIWSNPEAEVRDETADSLGIAGTDGATVFLVAYLDSGSAPNGRPFGHTGTGEAFGFMFSSGKAIFFASGKSVWGDSAGVYDGTEGGILIAGRYNADGKVELWQEGQYYRNVTGATTPLVTQSPNGVGCFEYDGNFQNFFDGGIAEVLVYGRALTDDEMNWVGWSLADKYGITSAYTEPSSWKTLTIQASETFIDTILPAPGSYQYPEGTTAYVSASDYINCPDTYAFDSWTGGDPNNLTNAQNTVLMDDDKNVTANYVQGPDCVYLTIETNPAGINAVTPTIGTHVYTASTVVDLSATDVVDCPDVWGFGSWSNNVDDAASADTSITMDADKAVILNLTNIKACGDVCHPYPDYDFNFDCFTNLIDFSMMATKWLECNAPECD